MGIVSFQHVQKSGATDSTSGLEDSNFAEADSQTDTAGPPSTSGHHDDHASEKGSAVRQHPTEHADMRWPESFIATQSLIARFWEICRNWSFAYMNPILKKGQRQFKGGDHLDLDDLYRVPPELQAEYLVQKFWQNFRQDRSVVWTLWKLAAPSFLPGAFWELINVAARVTLPLSLRHFLIVLEEAEPGASVFHQAIPFVMALTAAGLVGALATNRSTYLSTRSGITIRATLTAVIYRHALQLTPKGRQGLTTGEITNLVAVDTQKLYDVIIEGQNAWSCPLLVAVVTVLLWTLIGPSFVLGVVILLLFVPLIKTIVTKMLRIRKARSKMTDVRINLLTAMLQGMRVTKLNHYESMIETNVGAVRDQEMSLLRRELRLWGFVIATAVCCPLLAFFVAICCHVLIQENTILRPADTFASLLLFSILRFPINLASRLVGKAAQAIEAARRVSVFLCRESRECEPLKDVDVMTEEAPVLQVENGSFVIDEFDACSRGTKTLHDTAEDALEPNNLSNLSFALRNVDLAVKRGQLVAVVGRVGAGKTTLLRALLGDIPALDASCVAINGKVSYSSQEPFIANTSLRENVLFGSDYEEERYEKAVDACCLRKDIQRLGDARDLTQIGERGVTLSGGQKQRVALARAIYANPDLALLDDCFSALDSNTASLVFDRLFSSSNDGLLRKSGTILVTHALHLLPSADLILVMEKGSPIFLGTWSEMQQLEGDSKGSLPALIEDITNRDKDEDSPHKPKENSPFSERDGTIMTVEQREYGIASFWVWMEWFKGAGGWTFFISQMFLLGLDRAFNVLSDWWLAVWSDNATEGKVVFGRYLPPQSDGMSAQAIYLTVYAAVVLLSMIFSIIRSVWAVAGGARCANVMFRAMTSRVLRAPMSYFETTPLGRIINRFTYDVEVLDIELSVSMAGLMISTSWLVSSVIVMVAVLPWIALAIIPVGIIYFFIQLYYRMSGPDLQRIDAVTRSPLQATLAEGLEGSVMIRAYRKEEWFATTFNKLVDSNSSAMLNFLSAQRWLGLRIEILGTSITLTSSLIIACVNDGLQIPAGLVGLMIQWSVFFTGILNFFFLRLSESEARITSIERIHRATELPQEAAWETDPSVTKLDPSWPSRGGLEFDHVSMRYRQELPLAIESISFKLHPGSRCGVVGRTGAGKTSITACLFRIVEIEAGRILLDGVDLAKIGLSDVRGRPNGMRIIPQDPVLYSGTLRDCLDPFKQCQDDQTILEALIAVNHEGAVERGMSVLNERVDEGGSNLSIGERQLLCLARAIVEEPRVLVLDEATASVDTMSDSFIQTMLRTRFRNTTMLTIAHRLHTIMDYDTVLVLDDGRVAEFGPPWELIENPNGIFSSLVEANGSDATGLKLRASESKRSKSVASG